MIEKTALEKLDQLRKQLELRGFSKKTQNAYIFHVKKYLDKENKPTKELSQKDVEEHIRGLIQKNLKPATINLAISAIKYFYENVLKRSCRKIKRLKKEKTFTGVLEREDIRRILSAAGSAKQLLLVELMYSTGLRVSECVSLKVEDFRSGHLRKGKGRKDRYFLISKRAEESAKRYLSGRKRESEYLFETNRGHWTARTAQFIVKELAKRAGINRRVYTHMLRASFATHCLEEGVPLPTLQKLMGHERTETTLGYIRSSKAFMENVQSPLDKLYEKEAKNRENKEKSELQ